MRETSRVRSVRVWATAGVLASAVAIGSPGLVTPAAAVPAPVPGTITTIAGGPGGSVATGVGVGPVAVAFASPTVLVIADPANHVVRRVDTAAGTTTVIAGNGSTPYSIGSASYPYQTPVPATSVALSFPAGVAVDGGGNVYIADAFANVVVRVDPAGMMIAFAGGSTSIPPGGLIDGTPALGTPLVTPTGVAVAPDGALIIAEAGGHRVRRVAAGVATTLAGDPAANTAGYAGDGALATTARLNSPAAVAVNGVGDVFVADTGNHRVRRILAAGGTIATVAGSGTVGNTGDGAAATAATLSGPRGVAVDGAGNLFIADSGNHRVRVVASGSPNIGPAAGTGTPGFGGDGAVATAALLQGPVGLAATGAGTVAVADQLNARVRRFALGGSIATVAGNGTLSWSGDGGPGLQAQLAVPSAVVADGLGNVYVADTANHRVRKIAAGGTITTVAGTGEAGAGGDGGPATSAQLSLPSGVALDGDGTLYIADTGNSKVRKVIGGTISTVAGNGSAGAGGDLGPASSASLNMPLGLAVDQATHDLFIADSANNKVRRVRAGTISTVAGTGTYGILGDAGPATSADLAGPTAVAVRPDGTLVIADTAAGRIRSVAPNGIITTLAGPTAPGSCCYGYGSTTPVPAAQAYFNQPRGVAVDAGGAVYVAESYGYVRRIAAGMVTLVAGIGNGAPGYSGDGWLATQARLGRLGGVTVDGNGTVFVADTTNNRVRAFSPAGAGGVGFHPMSPVRILDSRDGTGGYNTPWPGCTSRTLTVAGAAGVPAGATAVVLNLTVTATSADSFLSVSPKTTYGYGYPVGTAVTATTVPSSGPSTTVVWPPYCYGNPSQGSTVNWSAGQTMANQTIAQVGEDGQVTIFNNAGNAHVIADVVGWFDAGTGGGDHYAPLPPARIVDSRDGTGVGGSPSAWGPGTTRDVQVTGQGGVPGGADAVLVNLTVTGGSATSHLRAWPAGTAMPNASAINFAPNQTVANLSVVKIGTGGKISLFNSSGSVHVIVDVIGYFSATSGDPQYVPMSPVRWVDTRQSSIGPFPMFPATTATIPFAGSNPPLWGGGGSALPAIPAGAKAVVVNVTVTQPTADGFLTLSPTGSPRPNASTINFVAGQTVANMTVVKLGTGGKADVYNAGGFTHVVLDVVGYFI